MFIELTGNDSDLRKLLLNIDRIVAIHLGGENHAQIIYCTSDDVIDILNVTESYDQVRSMLRMSRLLA